MDNHGNHLKIYSCSVKNTVELHKHHVLGVSMTNLFVFVQIVLSMILTPKMILNFADTFLELLAKIILLVSLSDIIQKRLLTLQINFGSYKTH